MVDLTSYPSSPSSSNQVVRQVLRTAVQHPAIAAHASATNHAIASATASGATGHNWNENRRSPQSNGGSQGLRRYGRTWGIHTYRPDTHRYHPVRCPDTPLDTDHHRSDKAWLFFPLQ